MCKIYDYHTHLLYVIPFCGVFRLPTHYDKLIIHLRFLKIISDITNLNISSVVSSVYTPIIPHLNTYAATRHKGIPMHHVPIISITMIIFVLPPLLIIPPPRIIFSTLTGAYKANIISNDDTAIAPAKLQHTLQCNRNRYFT